MMITQDKVLSKIKNVDIETVNNLYNEAISKLNKKIIVLDDDPTGVQTVHGIKVITDWEIDTLLDVMKEDDVMFFILTNSRSFTEEETKRVHIEISENIEKAAKISNQEYLLMSRSDSTLRGHYPLETQVLKDKMTEFGHKIHGEVIYPFFKEGGRLTIEDTHYVSDGINMVPASETDFAKDKSFGYKNSNLKEWIQEKTNGEFKADNVVSITLDELRDLEIEKIKEKLLAADNFEKIIVNSVDYIDTKIFTIALIQAINEGHNFIFRTAAALTKILGGVPDKPLLEKKELVDSQTKNGGIVVIGSHVKRTTEQFEELKNCEKVKFVEFNQHLVLDDEKFNQEVNRVIKRSEEIISAGETVVVYTRRERLDIGNNDKNQELYLTNKIAQGVTNIVGKLSIKPKFIVAKGGITSSDIGTKALKVKKALVMGQIQPGIPVWKTDSTSTFPNMPYIIFPGNVGAKDTLKKVVELLD